MLYIIFQIYQIIRAVIKLFYLKQKRYLNPNIEARFVTKQKIYLQIGNLKVYLKHNIKFRAPASSWTPRKFNIITIVSHYFTAKHKHPIRSTGILLRHHIQCIIDMLTRRLFVTAHRYPSLRSAVTYNCRGRTWFRRLARRAKPTSHDGQT